MKLFSVPLLYLRATLFWSGWSLATILVASIMVFFFLIPYKARYRTALLWSAFSLWWLRLTCGLGYRIEGAQHLRALDGAAVIMAKHQSTWETIATELVLPRQTWVVKKELLKVPFFGWGLGLLKPIAIDRAAGRRAVEQLIEQGRDRLQSGTWVVIFPEGTRVPPGSTRRYKMGGAVLATRTGFPVVPVAHNAGEFWPRHSYIKKPGQITLVIGEPIESKHKTPEELNAQVQAWIENEMKRISAVIEPD